MWARTSLTDHRPWARGRRISRSGSLERNESVLPRDHSIRRIASRLHASSDLGLTYRPPVMASGLTVSHGGWARQAPAGPSRENRAMSAISPAYPIEALAWQRLRGLPTRQREALRRAVETAERHRVLLHRTRAGVRPAPHPIALTPFVVPKRLVPRPARLARSVHRFQAKAPQLYRAGSVNFLEICPLDATTEAWLFRYGRPESDQDLMIRLDVGLTTNEGPILYETNSTALAGLFNHTTGVQILRRTVFPQLFSPAELRELQDPPDLLAFVFRWVTGAAARLGLRPRRQLGVAFVEPSGPGDGYSEIPQIARYFAANGVRAPCDDPGQLKLTPQGVVLAAGRQPLAARACPRANAGPGCPVTQGAGYRSPLP